MNKTLKDAKGDGIHDVTYYTVLLKFVNLFQVGFFKRDQNHMNCPNDNRTGFDLL